MPTPSPGYPLSDVIEQAGASYRQIDYWISNGLIPDIDVHPGHGNRRRFTEEQVLTISTLATVSDALRQIGLEPRLTLLAEVAAVTPKKGKPFKLSTEHVDIVVR